MVVGGVLYSCCNECKSYELSKNFNCITSFVAPLGISLANDPFNMDCSMVRNVLNVMDDSMDDDVA